MSTQDRTFFRRLNARAPWLKIVIIPVVLIFGTIYLTGLFFPRLKDPEVRAISTPMQKHVRIPKRDLEGKKLVALTFDDGPSPETTPTLLNYLYEEDAPATFFMLGYMAENNPDLVRKVAEMGNEVASHTMYHQNLIRISANAVAEDIALANAVFMSILGKTPALTRPPYGNTNDNVRNYAKTPLINWSVDTLDWKYKTTESILEYTLSEVYDGGIILMHDIHPTSVAAVPTVIQELRARGYEFVTVSELAEIRGISLASGVTYYSLRP